MLRRLSFFAFLGTLRQRFQSLKTTAGLQNHGPLSFGEEVRKHDHEEMAVYQVTEGRALFTSDELIVELGEGCPLNAVLVPSRVKHSWLATAIRTTIIEHVLGEQPVTALLAT